MARFDRLGVKIAAGLLVFWVILAVAIGWLMMRGFAQAEQTAVQHSAESLQDQSRAALIQLTSQEARLYDTQLEDAARVTRIAADAMIRFHEAGAPIDWASSSEPVVWIHSQLTRSPDGLLYYDANPERSTEILHPGNRVPDTLTDRSLRDSAVLDALFPGLLAQAEIGVGIYFQGPQLTFRYYPVRGLPEAEIANGAAEAAQAVRIEDFLVAPAHDPQRETVWLAPYVDDAGQGMLVSADTPIYYGDEFEGYIGIDVSLAGLVERLGALHPASGSFAFLVDGAGRLIAVSPDGAERLAGRTLSAEGASTVELFGLALGENSPALTPALVAAEAAQLGAETVVLGGEPHLVTYAPLPNLGWSLLVAAPVKSMTVQSQIVADSIRQDGAITVRNTLLAMAVLFSQAILASILLSFRFLEQPIRRLLHGVRGIASGELNVSVPVSSHDELGELAESFNQMAAELEQRTYQLSQTNAELQVQQAQVQVAALEERQRLARELHDSVSQALYGIVLGARTARTQLDRDPARAVEPLEYVLSQADVGLSEMRALIFELRPESLQNEGLVVALTKQADALRARYKLDIATVWCAEPEIALESKEVLYRIAQEALHNIAKHAGATRVALSLQIVADELVLTVGDNGKGFDPGMEFPGHLGLHSMRERATGMGAQLHIESRPGTGTTVTVRLPLLVRRTGAW
jgi:signal transduction histidine kinase